MTLGPDVVTVLQFETPKLRADSNISGATVKLETSGHRWSLLQGGMFGGDLEADAVFDIRAEASPHSLPARWEENNVAGRVWTKAVVQWAIPSIDRHTVVESPDLVSLLRELQDSKDWQETSTIALAFTPHAGSTGSREYKILLTMSDQMSILVGDFITYVFFYPAMTWTMQRTQLFGTNDGLEDASHQQSLSLLSKLFWGYLFAFPCLITLPIALMYLSQGVNNFKHGSPFGGVAYLGMVVTYPHCFPGVWIGWHAGFYFQCVSNCHTRCPHVCATCVPSFDGSIRLVDACRIT